MAACWNCMPGHHLQLERSPTFIILYLMIAFRAGKKSSQIFWQTVIQLNLSVLHSLYFFFHKVSLNATRDAFTLQSCHALLVSHWKLSFISLYSRLLFLSSGICFQKLSDAFVISWAQGCSKLIASHVLPSIIKLELVLCSWTLFSNARNSVAARRESSF